MLLSLILCAFLIGADQLIKYLVAGALAPAGHMPLIPGVIELSYYENDGAAFSILQGQQTLLIIITSLALLGALVYVWRFRRPQDKLEYITFILILSGGVGNLIDRITLGYVRDYFNLLFMRFAVFNFADMMVVVGFALLVFVVIRNDLRARRRALAEGAAADAEAGGNAAGGKETTTVAEDKDEPAEPAERKPSDKPDAVESGRRDGTDGDR